MNRGRWLGGQMVDWVPRRPEPPPYEVLDTNGLAYVRTRSGEVLGPDGTELPGWRIRVGRHGATACTLCGRPCRFRTPLGRSWHPLCASFAEDE